jgi:hypothetical protein
MADQPTRPARRALWETDNDTTASSDTPVSPDR